MQILNSDRYLQSFNRIERYLRQIAGRGRSSTFYDLVNDIARSNAVMRRYGNDLKEFADLRNAIVHERLDNRVIAEPNDLAVDWIERIEKLLTTPPRVLPQFQSSVTTAQSTDSVVDTARIMRERDHSQVPVFAGAEFIGLLTGNTLARWLGSLPDADCVDVATTRVGDILRYTERPDSYRFISKDTAIVEAEEMFLAGFQSKKEIDALLITEHGKPRESLLGIMTVWDLAASRELTRPGN